MNSHYRNLLQTCHSVLYNAYGEVEIPSIGDIDESDRSVARALQLADEFHYETALDVCLDLLRKDPDSSEAH